MKFSTVQGVDSLALAVTGRRTDHRKENTSKHSAVSMIFESVEKPGGLARGLTVKSLRINPSSSNFTRVTQTKKKRTIRNGIV